MKRTELTDREWEILHWNDRKWETVKEKLITDCQKFVELEPWARMTCGDATFFTCLLELEAGWGTGVSLRIDLDEAYYTYKDKTCLAAKLSCNLSWSSTTRDTMRAAAAIQLYQKAVNFAVLIESKYDDLYLVEDEEQN